MQSRQTNKKQHSIEAQALKHGGLCLESMDWLQRASVLGADHWNRGLIDKLKNLPRSAGALRWRLGTSAKTVCRDLCFANCLPVKTTVTLKARCGCILTCALNLAAVLTSSASNPDDQEQTTSQRGGKWHRNVHLLWNARKRTARLDGRL